MSLSPIAPWIVPPDYTGAMARGAQLGLSARAQDEKAASDALEKSRLQLAYEHLLEREKSSDALANKKFEFEQKKANDLQAYHTGLLAAQVAKSQPSAAEQLTTTQKDGLTYQLRGGKWYHIPSSNPLMDTVTEKIPAFEHGTPASPEIPAAQHWYGDQPFVPAKPAVEAHGEITRTRKVPSGLPTFPTAIPTPSAAALTGTPATNALDHAIKPGPFQKGYAEPAPAAPTDASAALKARDNPWWIRSRSPAAEPADSTKRGKLDKKSAVAYYEAAKGDKALAIKMAKDDGWEF